MGSLDQVQFSGQANFLRHNVAGWLLQLHDYSGVNLLNDWALPRTAGLFGVSAQDFEKQVGSVNSRASRGSHGQMASEFLSST